MIGKGATPSFFAIANDNYTLTLSTFFYLLFEKVSSTLNLNINIEAQMRNLLFQFTKI